MYRHQIYLRMIKIYLKLFRKLKISQNVVLEMLKLPRGLSGRDLQREAHPSANLIRVRSSPPDADPPYNVTVADTAKQDPHPLPPRLCKFWQNFWGFVFGCVDLGCIEADLIIFSKKYSFCRICTNREEYTILQDLGGSPNFAHACIDLISEVQEKFVKFLYLSKVFKLSAQNS